MTRLLLSGSLFFVTLSAFSQTDTLKSTNLDEVVVTATKSAIKQSQTGKVISVIDQATIQRNIGKSLTEILNYQTGIFINGANNAFGTNQDVYLRGASTGNTLILIDGVPMIDASQINNSFDLNSISPSQVERVEILKGAQSTLWGSDAVAGVINIITKKGGTKTFAPEMTLAYGTYNTFRGNAGINGSLNAFTYNINYSHTNSDGFSAAYDSTGKQGFDKDKFSQNNLQANLGYKLSPHLSLQGLVQAQKYTNALDAGAFTDDKDYTGTNRNNLYSLSLLYKFGKLHLNFVNTLQNSKRETTDDSTDVGGFSQYAHGSYAAGSYISELYGSYQFSRYLSLVAGTQGIFQHTDQDFESVSIYGPYKTALGKDSARINNYSLYASLLMQAGGFTNELGVRYNHHNIYGSNTTFSFNPSYAIDDNTRFFINVSSAFKMPTLYQLYSEYGNKSLSPEKSYHYEMGVQVYSNDKKNSLRLLGFKRDIKNLIVFYTDPATYASQYINRDKQNDYGFEVESTTALGTKSVLTNNLTYVDGEGKSEGEKVKNLYRRPNFTFYSTLSLQPVTNLTIAPTFRFVGTRIKGQYDPAPT